MYRGFNVKMKSQSSYYEFVGKELILETKNKTRRLIDNYIGVDGVIDGAELENDWFGEIQADIFISHSHIDEKSAVALAGYIYKKHGLVCFIDSCIWGYSNDLLLKLDKIYSKDEGQTTYNYKKRNQSTSHVHMMLSAALNKMIDNCECLFFLNTPNSIPSSNIKSETYSPWIYSELLTSKIIKKKIPLRLLKTRTSVESFSKAENTNESLKVKYSVDLNHFSSLNEMELENWCMMNSSSPNDALNKLYNMKRLRSLDNFL